eukprot:3506846-Alexandrium_andersonii.AAC.1
MKCRRYPTSPARQGCTAAHPSAKHKSARKNQSQGRAVPQHTRLKCRHPACAAAWKASQNGPKRLAWCKWGCDAARPL